MTYKEKRVVKSTPDPQASISKDMAYCSYAQDFLKKFL